jgi:ribonuclease HI
VIGQANRAIRTGLAVGDHAVAVLALAGEAPPARIRWIKRAQNLAGIALAARHPR